METPPETQLGGCLDMRCLESAVVSYKLLSLGTLAESHPSVKERLREDSDTGCMRHWGST